MATDRDTLDVPLPTGANISTTSLVTSPPRVLQPQDGHGSKTPIPQMTTSQSEYYQEKVADIVSRATVTDPMNVIFEQDKSGPSTTVTASLLYPAARARVAAKVKAGSFVAEAANFAAVVCWEPPEAVAPLLSETELGEMAKARPVFARFLRDQQAFKVATLGADQPFWNMSLMARDPDRNDKGAVRAVIEPFVTRARQDGVPIWLCAANERARDVYAYFGFRVVGVVYSTFEAEDDEGDKGDLQEKKEEEEEKKKKKKKEKGVPTWCMCCNWPVEPVREQEQEHGSESESGTGTGHGL
ncbi:hypothetical protein RBB50_002536 [Rhinocladiella similis]